MSVGKDVHTIQNTNKPDTIQYEPFSSIIIVDSDPHRILFIVLSENNSIG